MTAYQVISPSQSVRLAERVAPADRSFTRRLVGDQGELDDVPDLVWRWPLAGAAEDWVGTADMTRLVSPLVRRVLEGALGGQDAIQWLPATVVMPEGERLEYWVMHFPVWHDVLHLSASTWGPSGLPIRWVLDHSKLEGHQVFIVPELNDITIVTGDVLASLRAAGATGIAAEAARIV